MASASCFFFSAASAFALATDSFSFLAASFATAFCYRSDAAFSLAVGSLPAFLGAEVARIGWSSVTRYIDKSKNVVAIVSSEISEDNR